MKHSCARLAPKHVVADAEAAEQSPRKEADEATGSLGRESKCPGRTVARGCVICTSDCRQHFAGIQRQRGRSQIEHPVIDYIGIVVRVLLQRIRV